MIQAIELDREQAYLHTVLQQRAGDWAENNKSGDFLLNITACENAEKWQNVAVEEKKQPIPSELQENFIQESRNNIQKTNRRRNILFSFVGVLAVVAIILAIFAFVKMDEAEESRQEAERQKQFAIDGEKLAKKTRKQAEKLETKRTLELFESKITHASLLAQSENYANSKLVLESTHKLDKKIPISRRNVRNSLDHFVHMMGHKQSISKYGLVFHPTKPLLASISDEKTIFLWDVTTGKKLHTFRVSNINEETKITFSPDGQYLVVGCHNEEICFWEINSGKLWKMLQGHQNKVLDSKFIADGRYLVSGSLDRTLRIWDVDSGTTLRVLQGHTSGISAIAIHNDQLFSASYDNTVMRWKTVLPYQHYINLPTKDVFSLALAPNDNTVAIGFKDGTLRLYSLMQSRLLWEKQVHDDKIMALVFSPNYNLLVSASLDNTAKLWQFKTGKLQLQKIISHPAKVIAAAFSPDGKTLATAMKNGQISLFSRETDRQRFYSAHKKYIFSINFDASGTQLVVEAMVIRIYGTSRMTLLN